MRPGIYIPSHTHTHRGNSSGVGVGIKTNADESSFCEPHHVLLLGHFFFFFHSYSTGCLAPPASLCQVFSIGLRRIPHLSVSYFLIWQEYRGKRCQIQLVIWPFSLSPGRMDFWKVHFFVSLMNVTKTWYASKTMISPGHLKCKCCSFKVRGNSGQSITGQNHWKQLRTFTPDLKWSFQEQYLISF